MRSDESPQAITERRENGRRPVLYRLDVTDRSGTLVGFLVDIALGGMRVRCMKGVEVASVDELRIEFPRWMQIGEGVSLPGRFSWCKNSKQGKVEGGFVFAKLPSKVVTKLESMIDCIADAAVEDGEL